MAKFSQEFLRQMATPAFNWAGDVFTAAKQAAQLPAQLRRSNNSVKQRIGWYGSQYS